MFPNHAAQQTAAAAAQQAAQRAAAERAAAKRAAQQAEAQKARQAAQEAAAAKRAAQQAEAQQARQAAQEAAAAKRAAQQAEAQQARQAPQSYASQRTELQSRLAAAGIEPVNWKKLRRQLVLCAFLTLLFGCIFALRRPYNPLLANDPFPEWVYFGVSGICFLGIFATIPLEAAQNTSSNLKVDLSSMTPPPGVGAMTPPPDLESMTPPPDLESMGPPPYHDSLAPGDSGSKTPVSNAGAKTSAPPNPAAMDTANQQAWYLLTSRVAERLASLRDGGSGFIVEDETLPYYVRFTWKREEQALVCEAAGNGNLEAPRRLSESQQTELRNMGWHPPGQGDAYRSQDFVRVFYTPSNLSVAASLGIATLCNTYGASSSRVRWRTT